MADISLVRAPRANRSVGDWIGRNLFPDWRQGLLTVVVLYLLLRFVPPLFIWLLWDATWSGTRDDCVGSGGACWAFVSARWGQFIYGFYPATERWRVNVTMLLLIVTVVPLLMPRMRGRRWLVGFAVLGFPVVAYFLLYGGVMGLPVVETSRWGGLMLTLVVAITGMVGSLPLGILLALGRRSQMPAIRLFCTLFIELFRAVPLITVLFMASVMLPLFLPSGVTLDKLVRALIGVALFNGALMAEVVRGGLQAIPRGQYEAATAEGMGYWRMMLLIIMPQALRLVIPGIVNTYVAIIKDTTLVLIIGLFDLLGIVQAGIADSSWLSASVTKTGYVFAGMGFWVLCFGLSRYSVSLERRLNTGHSG
ncbi:amino acid ABC transporter permease [Paracoccus liaowanqingii]|uniref:Amino acid ABC transporter permease n=1 Tax=Paracoccus liaowanqingii TaxID=2560053 RepID=A0A4Z1CS51_9RHOB|nr:amino acid ABC transporter permease [Paracoccus liaowanqingii]TGN68179.1 amino acid ABC transporter permease [Paracoccus liaowanqingii]